MGNILAHSTPPPSSPLTPPIISEKIEDVNLFEEMEMGAPVKDSNPGTLEELHKQCTDIFPMGFEGGKFIMNKALSNHFQVSHTINLSTVQSPGYRFGATYLGTPISQSEVYPILVGDIDPQGNLNANIIHQICPGVRSKFVAQIEDNKWQASQFTTDIKGGSYTASLTVGNVDIFNRTGLGVVHYLQQVSPRLALGAEVAYQKGPQIPGGSIAVPSLAGKYSGDGYASSATIGFAGIHLCHYQRCSDSLQMGVELETSLRAGESVATTAFQIDIPKSNTVFKGKIDSNGTVGAVLEKKLMPLPLTLAISAMQSHSKNKFRLGVGFYIG